MNFTHLLRSLVDRDVNGTSRATIIPADRRENVFEANSVYGCLIQRVSAAIFERARLRVAAPDVSAVSTRDK